MLNTKMKKNSMTIAGFLGAISLIFVLHFLDYMNCGEKLDSPSQIAINYEVGEWPWMGSLGYWSDDEWTHQCGTTLISEVYFITAAHCIENLENR